MPTTSFDLHSILMQVREGTLYSHFTDKLSSGIAGLGASHGAQVVKNPPANAGDTRDVSSIPRSGRSPGGGHGNPPQYFRLGNPMDRGTWRATVYRIAESRTWLNRLSTHIAGLMDQLKAIQKEGAESGLGLLSPVWHHVHESFPLN